MDTSKQDIVQLLNIDSGYVVRIVESGDATDQPFLLEEHARAFAEGQRIRLRLSGYHFLPSEEDA